MPKKLTSFNRQFRLNLTLFATLAVVFAVYAWLEKKIDQANQFRHESIVLANELRQSSDDLTRMVRTYVVTRDPVYKKYFNTILDIRDGRAPRPAGYGQIYWDFITANQTPVRQGPARIVSFLDLMREAGFPEKEFAILAKAKTKSDELTKIEFEAMRLTQTTGPDAARNHEAARQMVFDATYHHAKADIMGAIQEVYESMDQRTLEAVHSAERDATFFRIVVIVCGTALLAALWRTFRDFRTLTGGPLDEIYNRIEKIGRGDYSPNAQSDAIDENSLLGWIDKSQRQLEQANTTLMRSFEELSLAESKATISTLIANVTHELKTPIANAEMTATLLFDQANEFTAAINAGKVKRSNVILFCENETEAAHLLLRNIKRANDLLTNLQRVSADQVSEQQREFDLKFILNDILETMAPSLKRHPHQVTLEVPSGIQMNSLPGPLGQIIINLINNAYMHAFTDDSSGLVTIRAQVHDDQVKLSITDNGVGIAPENLERIFQPFFSTKIGKGGTGLGMAIVKNLVEKSLKGKLHVTSAVGKGTRFEIVLPRMLN